MARPRPVPPARAPPSSCSNGWNIRARSCCAMPMPVSATTISTRAAASATALARRRDADRPLSGELDGVAHEVDEDLLHLAAISEEGPWQLGSRLDRQLRPVGGGLSGEHLRHLVERRADVERILDERQSSRLDRRHLEHVVDERREVLAALLDGLDPLPLVRAERAVVLEDQRVQQHHVQGAADLMGHVGEKPALGLAGPFGFILGFAQLARARRDELLEPLAVRAELGHVLDVSDHLDRLPAVIGDDRQRRAAPRRGRRPFGPGVSRRCRFGPRPRAVARTPASIDPSSSSRTMS